MSTHRMLFHIMAILLFAVLVVSGCRPGEAGAANIDSDDNNTCADENQCGDDENTEKTEEERYPFQVNAELAQVFLKYGMTEQAIRHFELAIAQHRAQTNSDAAEYYIGLGEALRRAEDSERAGQAYQKALQVLEQVLPNAESTKQHNQIITMILQVCGTLGLEEKHSNYLQRLRADDDNAAQQLELAQILQRAGHITKAETHFKRALQLTSENPADKAIVQITYANMLMAQEKYGEVLPLVEEAVAVEAVNTETRKTARGLLQSLCEIDGDENAETRRHARSLLLKVYGASEETDE